LARLSTTEKENSATGIGEQPKAIVEIAQEKCKGCELCVSVCPQQCIALDQTVFNSKGFHPAKYSFHGLKGDCTACGLCYMICPDYAVRSIKIRKEKG
jgi:2-oxoglutarate ferredoxin oxidoreductase subunit delta